MAEYDEGSFALVILIHPTKVMIFVTKKNPILGGGALTLVSTRAEEGRIETRLSDADGKRTRRRTDME